MDGLERMDGMEGTEGMDGMDGIEGMEEIDWMEGMSFPSHPPFLATQFYAACTVLKLAFFSLFFFISLLEHNLEFTEVRGKIWL